MPICIITGANSPLGIAIVRKLLKTHRLICVTHPTSEISNLYVILRSGAPIELQSCDLGSKVQINTLTTSLCNNLEKCDVLINNAFGWAPGGIQEISDDSICDLVSSSVSGTLLLTKNLLPLLKRAEYSRIINICSTIGTGYRFSPNTLYVSMKGALNAFGKSLRNELLTTNILVTNLNLGRFEDGDPSNNALTPVNDIARMISFILSLSRKTSIDSVVITPPTLNY